jgi:hypothetical protein
MGIHYVGQIDSVEVQLDGILSYHSGMYGNGNFTSFSIELKQLAIGFHTINVTVLSYTYYVPVNDSGIVQKNPIVVSDMAYFTVGPSYPSPSPILTLSPAPTIALTLIPAVPPSPLTNSTPSPSPTQQPTRSLTVAPVSTSQPSPSLTPIPTSTVVTLTLFITIAIAAFIGVIYRLNHKREGEVR